MIENAAAAPFETARERRWMVAVVALAIFVLFPYRHFAGDDAYISFRFAQNLATAHGFSFNPDQPTYGSTSPLWVGLLAATGRAGFSIIDGGHLLDALSALLLIPVFFRLSGVYIASLHMRVIASALLILDPWFVRWAMSGMENVLALLLLCVVMLAQQRQRGRAGVSVIAPLCCGLGILTRPEFAVFGALLFVDTIAFEKTYRTKKVAIYSLVGAMVIMPWLVYAWAHFGTIVPNTITAKISRNRGASLFGTLKYFGSFFTFEATGLALVLLLEFKRILTVLRNPEGQSRWFLPVSWMLALPTFYAVGGAPVAGRYLLLGLPAYLLLGVRGWELLLALGARQPWVRATVVAFVALTLALVMDVQARYDWYLTKWPEGMSPRLVELARWLRANAGPDDLIAADQVGVLGYFSERRILDVAGLISPEMQPARRQGEKAIWEAVRRADPQWIIALDDKAHLVSVVPDLASLELVDVYEIQREGAQSAGGTLAYKLFRTGWRKDD